jgi:hypothetical protein
MKVELVYEKTCPNIEAARAQLLKAFAASGIMPKWREWEVSSPEAPQHIHGYGSPTILVDGHDVSGGTPGCDDYCCRIYAHDEDSHKGIPALQDIVSAIKASKHASSLPRKTSRWRLNAAMLPGVGAAFLPKLACPACWPAYAGLLSSLGFSFINYTPYLLPLTATFLLIAVAALAYRAPKRRGYRPFLLGLVAAALVLVGKFHYDSDAALYTGISLLVLASLWNTWPKSTNAACPGCAPLKQE